MGDAIVLVMGTGNSLRSDDAVAAFIIGELQKNTTLPAAYLLVQQLTTDLIPAMLPYKNILLIDAAVGINTVTWNVVHTSYAGSGPSSHHVDIAQMQRLGSQLFQRNLSITVCTIPVHNLALGESLSGETLQMAKQAVNEITDWMQALNS